MTHVAMITRGYPTPDYPTMGIFEADYAHALARAGVQVSYLSVDMRSFRRKRPWGMSAEEKDGITLYRIDWPVGAVPKKWLYRVSFLAVQRVWQEMLRREGSPDLIHTVFTDYAVLGAMMKEKTGLPLYVCENFSHIHVDPIDPDLKKAAEYAYPRADVIQSVSPAFQQRLKEVFGVDSVEIPNLPDLKQFAYADTQKQPLLVSAGRVTDEKGMPELLDALLRIKDDFPALRLEIFGEGNRKTALEQRARDEGVADRVIFHGNTDRNKIAQTYRDAGWFALCSHHETFGLAYIEAWAAGMPVLATRCGGPDHLVTPENGVSVPVGDPAGIEAGLRRLLTTGYNRKEIARCTRERFSEERIVGAILDEYEKIL